MVFHGYFDGKVSVGPIDFRRNGRHCAGCRIAERRESKSGDTGAGKYFADNAENNL